MANDNWRTPVEVFAYYDKTYDFQCDVAASNDNALCERYYTQETNALTSDWAEFFKPNCFMWCNPPYSDPLPWSIKIIQESQVNGLGTLMLVNHDMSVEWSSILTRYQCQIDVYTASGSKADKTYCNGRIAFIDGNGQPVKQNNKPQCAIIVPPYVQSGEPFTNYLPLSEVMADGLTALEKRLSL